MKNGDLALRFVTLTPFCWCIMKKVTDMGRESIALPRELGRLIDGQPYVTDNIGLSGSQVLLFEDKVLKIQPAGKETRAEHAMMTWLEGKLPVPRCLYHAEENGLNYLLMTKIHGDMSCDAMYMREPRILIWALAESLKQLWQVDVSDCPVKWDLKHKLALAETLVEQGKVDVENTEPETFGENGFRDPQALLRWLQEHQPEEDLVLSHGDFCLPNVFLEDGRLAGLIDLGRMGIADRWQDIALCYRSLKHNADGRYTGVSYEKVDPNLLFEALGLEPDWEKLRYYTLLDELF